MREFGLDQFQVHKSKKRASLLQSTFASALALFGTTACNSNNYPDFSADLHGRGVGQQGEKTPVKYYKNTNGVVDYPIAESIRSEVQVQQAWIYQSGEFHLAVDYARGKLDNSKTWVPFAVLAAADGFACANPGQQQGKTVWEEVYLNQGGKSTLAYYVLEGHLASIDPTIPECNDAAGKRTSNRKPVKMGEQVGVAGSTGMDDASLLHLHFEVKTANDKPIDPYGLNSYRDNYPDLIFTNGKTCGPSALFINCPINQSFVLVPEAKAAERLGPPKELVIENRNIPALATPTRAAVLATATSTPKQIETPKPIPTPKAFKPGDIVNVTGIKEDCLLERVTPSASAAIKKDDSNGKAYCTPEGKSTIIAQGPTFAEGSYWWKSANNGWIEDKYLYRSGSSPSPLNPTEGPKQPEAGWKTYLGKQGQNQYKYQVNIPNTFAVRPGETVNQLDSQDIFEDLSLGYKTYISIGPTSIDPVIAPPLLDNIDAYTAKVSRAERGLFKGTTPIDIFSDTVGGKSAARVHVKLLNGSLIEPAGMLFWSNGNNLPGKKSTLDLNQFIFTTPGGGSLGYDVAWTISMYSDPAVTDKEMVTLRKMLDSFRAQPSKQGK